MQEREDRSSCSASLKRSREENQVNSYTKQAISCRSPPKHTLLESYILQNGDSKAFWYFPSLTYEINNTRKCIESPFFETSNGDRWNLMLWPSKVQNYIALFVQLEVPENKMLYKRKANVYLEVYFTYSKLERKIQQNFNEEFSFVKRDWGYDKFIKVNDYISHTNKPVIIEATISPYRPHEESKKITGYNGINNEGTTCYINSLLQTLYFISFFRKAVYVMPTSEKDEDRIPLSLQLIFYHLQFAKTPANTRDLLKSFGWTSDQWHVQHDVQEFNCILSDTLEKKMRDTPSEGTYSKLFKGKMKNFIECSKVKYKSEQVEIFIDLQLNVQGCSSIIESFEKYTEIEVLDGDNMYEAEGFGKQVAKKGVVFEYLPPVLQLQLKRFAYDYDHGVMTKLNQFYQFDQTINLNKYVSSTGDWTYSLFSILVHRGTAQAGHYFSYISPKLDGKWYIFNDDSVDSVITSQALQSSFGGEITELEIDENGFLKEVINKNETSAYMLVYIRCDKVFEILPEINERDIPKSLSNIYHGEANKKEKETKDKEIKESMMSVFLTSKEIVHRWEYPGISNPDTDCYELERFSLFKRIRAQVEVKKTAKGSELNDLVSKYVEGRFKLWVFCPGFIGWVFKTLNLNESLSKQVNNKAVFVESPQTVFEYNKDKGSWEFVCPDVSSPCSQLTEILGDETDDSKKKFLVFKWYDWNEGCPFLSVLKAESICMTDLSEIKQAIYHIKFGSLNDYDGKIHIYIEKSAKVLMERPSVKALKNNYNFEIIKKEIDSLDHGDCIIGEPIIEMPEFYKDPIMYIEEKFEQVILNILYYNKLSKYGVESYSFQVLKDSNIFIFRVFTKLSCTEEELVTQLISTLNSSEKIEPKQIDFFTEDNSNFNPLNRDNKRKVSDFLALNKQLAFDISPMFDGKAEENIVVYLHLVDDKFETVKQFCKVLKKPAKVKDLEEVASVDLLGDLNTEKFKSIQFFLLNHPQRCIVKELSRSDELDKISNQNFNIVCCKGITEEENLKKFSCQKIYLYSYNKGQDSGYSEIIYIDKLSTVSEVIKLVSQKFSEKVRIFQCETKVIGDQFELKPNRVVDESEMLFLEKFKDGYLAVELPSIGNGKNQLKIYRN